MMSPSEGGTASFGSQTLNSWVQPDRKRRRNRFVDKQLDENVGFAGLRLQNRAHRRDTGILSQEGVDEKTQNAILQRMDKKEYEEAFKLCDSEKCRSMLEGLLN